MLLLLGGDNGNLSVALGKKVVVSMETTSYSSGPNKCSFTFTYIMGLGEPDGPAPLQEMENSLQALA